MTCVLAWVHVPYISKVRCKVRAIVGVVGKMLVRRFDEICALLATCCVATCPIDSPSFVVWIESHRVD